MRVEAAEREGAAMADPVLVRVLTSLSDSPDQEVRQADQQEAEKELEVELLDY